MFDDLIKNAINFLFFTPYEEALLSKYFYGFKLKKSELFDINIICKKIQLRKLLINRK